MKKLLCLPFLTLTLASFSQIGINWGDPIQITDMADLGTAIQPKVASDADGNVVVVWGQATIIGNNCYASRLVDGTFTAPVELSTLNNSVITTTAGGPHIDEHDGVFFTSYTYSAPSFKTVTRKSTDGGVTWEDEAWVDEWLWGDWAYGQHMDVDGEGHPHVSMVRVDAGNFGVGALCSVDYGDSYTSFVPASDILTEWLISIPTIAIDGDRHCVIWRTYNEVDTEAKLWAALSTNNGATFDDPVLVYTETDAMLWEDVEDPQACICGDWMVIAWETASDPTQIMTATLSVSDLNLSDTQALNAGISWDATFKNPKVECSEYFWATIFHHNASGANEIAIKGNFEAGGFWTVDVPSSFANEKKDGHLTSEPNGVESHDVHLVCPSYDGLTLWYLGGESFVDLSVPDEDVQLTIYPNPASDQLTLNLPSELIGQQIFIHDQLSRKVMEFRVESTQMTIDVSHLPAGNYTLSAVGMRAEVFGVLR